MEARNRGPSPVEDADDGRLSRVGIGSQIADKNLLIRCPTPTGRKSKRNILIARISH